MNKINLKKILLITTTACTINAPLFAMAEDEPSKKSSWGQFLERDFGFEIGKFLPPEDLAVMNKTSKQVRSHAVHRPSYEQYAECIVNDQPVPLEIKDILGNVLNSAEKEKNAGHIATHILKYSKGMFYRNKPLPPFLAPFFRAVSPTELDDALQPLRKQGILPAAVLHMKTYGNLWVKEDASAKSLINLIKTYAKSYITLKDALALPKGTTIPKRIIATPNDIETRDNFEAMDILFERYPDHELILHFEHDRVAHISKHYQRERALPDSLRNISLVGENLTTIGNNFLLGCTRLTSVTIPNSVTKIGDNFLSGCYGLTSVTISNSVTTIGDDFLSYCHNLTSVTIPNSVTTIGTCFLSGCKGLTFFTIPNNVTTIENCFLLGCEGLTTIIIPNSVTTIGNGFLHSCKSLTTIMIPNSVTTIGNEFLSCCYGLISVTIPNSITRIRHDFLKHCMGLTSVTIPNSVTRIGDYFLWGCDSLTSVTIPKIFQGSSILDNLSKKVNVIFDNNVNLVGG